MQINVSLLNGALNNSFRSTGASTGSEYVLYLVYSDATVTAGQNVVFNNASNGSCNLNTKPVYFAIPAGKTVSKVALNRVDEPDTPSEVAFMAFEVLLDTPEVYSSAGTFTVLDLTVSISAVA